jgi:pentatricopeptide repeat protein
MLKHGISPSAVTFVCILKACSITGAADEGFRIHAEIVKRGCLELDPYVGSTLIDMYAKCGNLANAQNVFDKLVHQDAATWTALIQAYVEQGHASEALERFEQMQRRSVPPTIVTFVCTLRACGSVKALDIGHRIHVEITKRGLEREIQIGNTLIDMYAKGRSLAEAHRVFDGLAIQDVVSWTALLMGYADQGDREKVRYCIENLQHRCVHLGPVALVCVLKACASIEATGKGQEVHSDLTKRGSEDEITAANALIDMYAKCGELADAENIFGKLCRARDAVSWATIVLGYVQLGQDDDLAFRAFEGMVAGNLMLDLVAFLSVLNACSHAGLVDAAIACFETVGNNGLRIVPAVEQYASLIDALARSGRVEEAWIVVQQMPVHPTLVVWLIVLAACRNGGNVELAKQAFEHAISSDDADSAPYVCMSNIYAVECSDEG